MGPYWFSGSTNLSCVVAIRPISRDGDGPAGPVGAAPPAATAAARQPGDRHLGAFRPIRLQKAADTVVAVIADAIRGGLYGPGDLLPTERNLAAQLEVSRNVVREAIDRLRREGVVSVRRGPTGGITVVSDARLREVIASLRGETHDLMVHALRMRRTLEFPGFALAAGAATDEELQALEPLVTGLEVLEDDLEEFYVLDRKFHLEVVRLSGNLLLVDCYHATLAQMGRIRSEFPVLQVPIAQALENQRALYAALLDRRREALAAAVNEHLGATEIVYLGQPLADL